MLDPLKPGHQMLVPNHEAIFRKEMKYVQSATRSKGTTGVKMIAELLEQEDAMGSAVGTTRAAVRRSISESRDVV
jgi:hypothetical protein